eukprot:2805626-Prymnesium_polylepis.1
MSSSRTTISRASRCRRARAEGQCRVVVRHVVAWQWLCGSWHAVVWLSAMCHAAVRRLKRPPRAPGRHAAHPTIRGPIAQHAALPAQAARAALRPQAGEHPAVRAVQ